MDMAKVAKSGQWCEIVCVPPLDVERLEVREFACRFEESLGHMGEQPQPFDLSKCRKKFTPRGYPLPSLRFRNVASKRFNIEEQIGPADILVWLNDCRMRLIDSPHRSGAHLPAGESVPERLARTSASSKLGHTE